MLTGCLWGTGYIWLWLSSVLARLLTCNTLFLTLASTAPCYADWANILVSWRLPIDWWDLPRQPPSVSALKTVFAALCASYSVSGGRSLRTLVMHYAVLTVLNFIESFNSHHAKQVNVSSLSVHNSHADKIKICTSQRIQRESFLLRSSEELFLTVFHSFDGAPYTYGSPFSR